MLQACDAHSPDYVERLKDERRICQIIEALSVYGESHATTEEICRVHLLRIKHLYYKVSSSEIRCLLIALKIA